MAAAFISFKTFYMFEADASFGIQMVALNFGVLLFLWFLSFIHSGFIRENIFLLIVLPLTGLYMTNLMFGLTTPGTSIHGYLSFVLSSSILIFVSYKARVYEKQVQQESGAF